MKHVVIKDDRLNGWEYGMLRSFEMAIVEETGASVFEIPKYEFVPGLLPHFGQGMKRGVYRKYFPKQEMKLECDVAWCILMGPENYRLDLYTQWDKTCKIKILYFFDTLPGQYPLIKRILSNHSWDILITSFNDAVDDLEKITGRKWHCVEQAVDKRLFHPVSFNERKIQFSAYGRKYPVFHQVLKDFCGSNGLYYDYTTHDAKHPVEDATELYRQYAWHLSHSVFTVSWPVELTSPARAGHLHPITCRWFEAAASGTAIIGKQPDNPIFAKWLGKNLVFGIDPNGDRQELYRSLEEIWSERMNLSGKAISFAEREFSNWTWNERVKRIISWL